MPAPSSRRWFLVASGGAAASIWLTGCTAARSGSTPTGSAPTKPSADDAARLAAAATERRLADLATRTVAALRATSPALAASATLAAAGHTAHVKGLIEGLAGPGPRSSPVAAPGVAALTKAQDAASATHLAALATVSGPLARLLASVAASDASFAAALRAGSR